MTRRRRTSLSSPHAPLPTRCLSHASAATPSLPRAHSPSLLYSRAYRPRHAPTSILSPSTALTLTCNGDCLNGTPRTRPLSCQSNIRITLPLRREYITGQTFRRRATFHALLSTSGYSRGKTLIVARLKRLRCAQAAADHGRARTCVPVRKSAPSAEDLVRTQVLSFARQRASFLLTCAVFEVPYSRSGEQERGRTEGRSWSDIKSRGAAHER